MYATYGLGTYFGTSLPKEKLFIEELFENRIIDTVVGTDALALGVNFPVENVVFTQLAKYYEGPISKNLFDQLSGRAGRKGYFDQGKVYYCEDFGIEARDYDTKELYNKLLLQKNESVNIKITPNIKEILNGEKTIEEEEEFILKYSTKTPYSIEFSIKEQLSEIKNCTFIDKEFKKEKDWLEKKIEYLDR